MDYRFEPIGGVVLFSLLTGCRSAMNQFKMKEAVLLGDGLFHDACAAV